MNSEYDIDEKIKGFERQIELANEQIQMQFERDSEPNWAIIGSQGERIKDAANTIRRLQQIKIML